MRSMAKVLALVVLIAGFPVSLSYAGSGPGGAKEEESDRLVTYRYAEATNPRCGAAATVAEIGGKAIGPALGIMITGAILVKIPVGWTTKWGVAMMTVGVSTVAAAVGVSSAYFVCNWSFVRHPVLRFEEGDVVQGRDSAEVLSASSSSSSNIGKYKECEDPYSPDATVGNAWKSSGDCTKEFADLNSYFACIAKDKSLEAARMLEPVCKSRKFKTIEKYAWPKNRVSSSRYIEVCYRKPLATLFSAPYRALRNSTKSASYTEQIMEGAYPREGTYGDKGMHKTKLAISGAGDDNENSGYVKCEVLKAGETKKVHDASFRAVERGDKLCVDAINVSGLPLLPRPEIGCHMRPNSPPVPMCEKSEPIVKSGAEGAKVVGYNNEKCYSCYVDQACQGVASLHTKSPFPVTSVLVNCIVGSLKNVLDPTAGGQNNKCANKTVGGGANPGFLKVAQSKLKKAVMATLILALILFSIKAMLGGVQNASELYMTVIKFALVIYFTQGDAMYKAHDYLSKLSISLSDIVLSAANGGQNICDYKAEDYSNKDFLYLMPWDRLDCRMMFYLGSQLNGGTGSGVLMTVFLCAGLLIPAILINAKVIICVVAFFAVMMLIFTVIWCVYVFLLSLIALTVLTIISPLMIPMCLFQVTKGFFDGWTRQLMVYSLYPVILFAFLSLMFTVFDNIYFGELQFVRDEITVGSSKRINFKLANEKICDDPKMDSNLACMFSTVTFHTKPLVLGLSVTSPEFKNTTAAIWTKLGVFVLVGFLFYHFLSSISYIAGELAGDPRAGVIGAGSFNPRALASGAMGAASKAGSYAAGKMSDLGSKAMNQMKSGGSSSGSDSASGGSTPRKGGAGGTDSVSGGSSSGG
ncbi:TrbL/VirB6 family protein [Anaplasma capra]|uniref:type IV secretion system protein n=1 Tax=Anaplasma capra TaxID=1562740 RepID=UPI0037C0931A|nr:type IV secretion system protein [Anaplasma capra]